MCKINVVHIRLTRLCMCDVGHIIQPKVDSGKLFWIN